MPPKKNPDESNDEPAFDAIADATSRLLDDTDEDARDRENAEMRNSTNSQTHDSAFPRLDEGANERRPPSGSAREDVTEADASSKEGSPSDGSQGDSSTSEKDRLPGPYVPSELSYALQEAQLRLRRMTGDKISQSLIIECALEICLRDFERRQDESALARLVRKRS